MTDRRPDPDSLLARLEAGGVDPRRGRLKLFFGASAGVGKTFAMLQEAQEKRRSGADVVLGYIETHKRPETDALKGDLEELPPRWVDYRGVRLREFDLDAALARRPALILVDELAHTNAEGLRHAKRYQDVLELLEAGIDVYTTVNVQHIESLNDVIAQITGIPVRETVPDSIIERADEIELVDLPPDDLLQRLREGKVYLPEQAERAAAKFFRKEVLVALRELALRTTADRVNAQVQVEKAGRAIIGKWTTAERLLVCVGPSPLSARVIRVARRMAANLRCEWLAVYVETPALSAANIERVRRNLRLAERLGAEPITLAGEKVADELVAFAQKRNVSRIIIGKPVRSRWQEWLRRSIVADLVRKSGDIDVLVVKGEPEEQEQRQERSLTRKSNWREYAASVAVVAICTVAAWPLCGILSPVNLTMIYLAGVVFVATRFGPGPSATAGALAPLAFDFFFTVPYYRFAISDAQYVITFVTLLVTALIVSGLAQRVQQQAMAARRRYERTAALYFMSRQLAGAADRDAVMRVAGRHVADVFGGDVVLLSPTPDGQLDLFGQSPEWFGARPNEFAAAQWVFDHQQWAGHGTDTLPASQAVYVPLAASGKPLGVLGLRQRERGDTLEPDQRHMLETFATQLAIALERAAFASQAEAARRDADTEQIRSSLLSCVSHDLRTPLAAIAGAASTLVDGAQLPASTRHELAQSIAEEAARLNQLVGKLLDMTRLESTGFRLQRDWYPLDELVGAALTRQAAVLKDHRVLTDLPNDLPYLHVDGQLIEELLGNLLENAARYTPHGSTVTIRATSTATGVRVEVLDEGPGLPPGAETEVFRRFVRHRPAGDRQGAGLGLAICEAVVRLHGGEIAAGNRPMGGARFWFVLPHAPGGPPELAGMNDPPDESTQNRPGASEAIP